MSPRTRLRVIAAAAALLAGLAMLTGCGDDGRTVSSGKGSKVKVDDDKATVETTEGTWVRSDGAALPDGFPVGDLPLVDATLVSGTKGAEGGPIAWSVVMQSARSVDGLAAEVKKDYASWKSAEGTGTALGDVSILHFASAKYEVGVTIARTGSNVTVTYVVKDVG
jgi:hypothetical protein